MLVLFFGLGSFIVNVDVSDDGLVPDTSFAGLSTGESTPTSRLMLLLLLLPLLLLLSLLFKEDVIVDVGICFALDQSAESKCFRSLTIKFFLGIIPPYFARSFSSCSRNKRAFFDASVSASSPPAVFMAFALVPAVIASFSSVVLARAETIFGGQTQGALEDGAFAFAFFPSLLSPSLVYIHSSPMKTTKKKEEQEERRRKKKEEREKRRQARRRQV